MEYLLPENNRPNYNTVQLGCHRSPWACPSTSLRTFGKNRSWWACRTTSSARTDHSAL